MQRCKRNQRPRLQNSNGLTPPFCFAKSGGFTGDQQCSSPRYGQKLLSMRLTPVASRGRPGRSAAESSFAQWGGTAQSGTTPHNSETQALTFSSCSHSNSSHSGPKARMERRQNQVLCAGREEYFPNRTLIGSGPADPGNFAYFPSLESSSPGGEISCPRPARRRDFQVRTALRRRPQGAALPERRITSVKGKDRALALHHMGFRFHGQINKNLEFIPTTY